MKPRIVTRTHYQVDEPAYLRILIRDCSSPTASEYAERIAGRLHDRMLRFGKDFNLTAANYCVDLARSLNLLSENNFWSWLAFELWLLDPDVNGEPRLDLSLSERIFYFRLFLEYDGVALLFLARTVAVDGRLPRPDENWNDVANEMMKFAYSCYLEIVTDIPERAEIRQLLDKRNREPYSGKSGPHQCFIHLQAMTRIGLLRSKGREYRLEVGEEQGALVRFLEGVPNVRALEEILTKRQWPSLAFKIFSGGAVSGATWTDDEILDRSRRTHDRIMSTGVALCPMDTLIELIQIAQIAANIWPISRDDCLNVFRRAQRQAPKKIRFHVDRMGRPAFIAFL